MRIQRGMSAPQDEVVLQPWTLQDLRFTSKRVSYAALAARKWSPSGLGVTIPLDLTTSGRRTQGEAASHRWRRWQAAIVHSRDRRAWRGRCCRRPTSCYRCRKRSPPLRTHQLDVEQLCAASRASRSKRSAAAHCQAENSDRTRTSEQLLFKDAFEARLLACFHGADHFCEDLRVCGARQASISEQSTRR